MVFKREKNVEGTTELLFKDRRKAKLAILTNP